MWDFNPPVPLKAQWEGPPPPSLQSTNPNHQVGCLNGKALPNRQTTSKPPPGKLESLPCRSQKQAPPPRKLMGSLPCCLRQWSCGLGGLFLSCISTGCRRKLRPLDVQTWSSRRVSHYFLGIQRIGGELSVSRKSNPKGPPPKKQADAKTCIPD